MNTDQSQQAENLLLEERARRPRWLRVAQKAAPLWFSGKELDLLEPIERDTLYRELYARTQTSRWSMCIVATVNAPNILRRLSTD